MSPVDGSWNVTAWPALMVMLDCPKFDPGIVTVLPLLLVPPFFPQPAAPNARTSKSGSTNAANFLIEAMDPFVVHSGASCAPYADVIVARRFAARPPSGADVAARPICALRPNCPMQDYSKTPMRSAKLALGSG